MSDLRIWALHCGGARDLQSVYDPFDPDCGSIVYIPYFCFLIEHPAGLVLFDTGPHPGLGVDPVERLGADGASFEVEMASNENVVARLAELGVDPTRVEHVALSHLHYDHAGGIEFFAAARFYVQEAEWAFAHEPPVYQTSFYFERDFDHAVDWWRFAGSHDLFGDGLLTLFPSPGHTPGHQSLLVELASGPVVIVADAVYSLEKMTARRLPGVLWNPDRLIESWKALESLRATRGAELLLTHDPQWRDRMRLAPDACYE